MPTIKDVATRAHVTPATVSNVIREKGIVSPETRRRVRAAIEELGYRPNLLARGLARGRSDTLALLLPSIAHPFYPEIALEIERLAREQGYQLVLCNTRNDRAVGREYLERCAGGWIDGVLALAGGIDLGDLHGLAARGVPVVRCLFAEELEGRGLQSDLSSVDANFERAAELVARHLTELGHRRFAAVVQTRADGQVGHVARLRGFRAALCAAGISLTARDVLGGDPTLAGGYQAVTSLLSRADRPTALLVGNDLMALGAVGAVFDAGLNVPGDLSVVGLGNLPVGAHVRPALTTAAFQTGELARHTVDVLLEQIQDPSSPKRHIYLEPHLVVRRSSAPPRQG